MIYTKLAPIQKSSRRYYKINYIQYIINNSNCNSRKQTIWHALYTENSIQQNDSHTQNKQRPSSTGQKYINTDSLQWKIHVHQQWNIT